MTGPETKLTQLPDGRTLALVEGNDAMSVFVDVWLSGFVSGASSSLATLAPASPLEQRDTFAQDLCAGLRADPLAVEEVRAQVIEILTGTDSGPKEFTVANPDEGGDQP